jgi:hypothetical protein
MAMNTVLRTLVLGAALLLAPALLGFSAPVLALAAIAAGVAAAWPLHGRLDALTVSAGAFAALALVGLSGAGLPLAGAAFVALAAGIAPNIPGFLGTVGAATVPQFWVKLYHYAWFVSFGLAFGVYLALMPRRRAVLPSTA